MRLDKIPLGPIGFETSGSFVSPGKRHGIAIAYTYVDQRVGPHEDEKGRHVCMHAWMDGMCVLMEYMDGWNMYMLMIG